MTTGRIMEEKNIIISEAPSLKSPCLVAAWPGMGNVALTTVQYLIRQLNAQAFAKVPATDYFAPSGAQVSKQLIQPPASPMNQFYYYQSPDQKNDILFFLSNSQPIIHREYAFATKILEFAAGFGARIAITTAAAPSDMHFKDKPRVFVTPNHESLLKQMMEYKVHFMGEGNIAGMNGLLISVAAEKGMRGMCLLGEIPFFTAQIEYPRAAIEIVRVLCRLVNIKVDLVDLELYTNQKDKELAPLSALLVRDDEEKTDETAEEESTDATRMEISESIRIKVEKLFRQAEFDQTYKSKMRLKEMLDHHGLFDEYLDRFLDLFKKTP